MGKIRRKRFRLPDFAFFEGSPKRSLAASDFFCGRRSEKACDFCGGMLASPLAATVVRFLSPGTLRARRARETPVAGRGGCNLGAPTLGSAERGHPDFFRFVPISPFCSDLRSLFSGIPRFVPICSVLFRFVPRTNQNKSEQIRETPFCWPLLKVPDNHKFLSRSSLS